MLRWLSRWRRWKTENWDMPYQAGAQAAERIPWLTADDEAERFLAVPCPVCHALPGEYCRNTVTHQQMRRPGVVIHGGRCILFERAKPELLT